MKQVDIIKLYASDDENFCMGALHTYLYVDGDIVLAGSDAQNVDDMIHGAEALMHFLGERFTINRHHVANATIYREWKSDYQKIYEHVIGTKETEEKVSAYGNF